MALQAASFRVLAVIKRMKPERIEAVRLNNRRGGAPVSAVTSGAAEAVWVVNLKKLAIRVRNESARHVVRLLVAGHEIRWRQFQRLAHAQVACLATVNKIRFVYVNLLDCEIEIVVALYEAVNLLRSQTDQMIFKIIVALLRGISVRLQQVCALAQKLSLLVLKIVVEFFKLREIQLLLLYCAVVVRVIDCDLLGPLPCDLLANLILGRIASGLLHAIV